MKAGPLSLYMESSAPNLGMMSFSKAHDTSEAFSVLVGYVLTQLEKVSTKTNRYLKFLATLGVWVKSTCQSLKGCSP
jgi:hypothetical protein